MSARRLVLVRHAKAVQDSSGSDRSRALNGRGKRQCAAVGAWLAGRLDGGRAIGAVWCSSAVRADQTWELVAAGLVAAPRPEQRADLYEAGPDDLLEDVRQAEDGIQTLVVVGHNPTVEQLHAVLTGDGRGFSTGATAILEADGDWTDLVPGGARLVDFFAP